MLTVKPRVSTTTFEEHYAAFEQTVTCRFSGLVSRVTIFKGEAKIRTFITNAPLAWSGLNWNSPSYVNCYRNKMSDRLPEVSCPAISLREELTHQLRVYNGSRRGSAAAKEALKRIMELERLRTASKKSSA